MARIPKAPRLAADPTTHGRWRAVLRRVDAARPAGWAPTFVGGESRGEWRSVALAPVAVAAFVAAPRPLAILDALELAYPEKEQAA